MQYEEGRRGTGQRTDSGGASDGGDRTAAPRLSSISMRQTEEEASRAAREPVGRPLPDFQAAFEARSRELARSIEAPPRLSADVRRGSAGPGIPVPAASAGVGDRQIIGGVDDRTPVKTPQTAPYAYVCYIEYTPPRGPAMRGSGWLAGPRTVITAGHVVWDRERGNSWSRDVQVYAGGSGTSGARRAGARDLHTVTEWAHSGSEAFDYGAITLDKPLGTELGFFGFANFPDDDLRRMIVNVIGYPGEKNPPTMWGHADRIQAVRHQQLDYVVDTTPGNSGAPVVCWSGEDKFLVVGIHNNGAFAGNLATRINQSVFDQLAAWKNL